MNKFWIVLQREYNVKVVYSSMHCRWMFCRIFKNQCHHKNEVSSVCVTGNSLSKRTIQSFCDVDYHIRYFDFKRMVSKSKLALDSILYVLRIYAWRSYFTSIICTHNVMAWCKKIYFFNHAYVDVLLAYFMGLSF